MCVYIFVYFVLFILLHSKFAICEDNFSKDVADYLKYQMEFVTNEITNNADISAFSMRRTVLSLNFGNNQTIPIQKQGSIAHMFCMFNVSYILMDTKLFFLSHLDQTFAIEFYANFTSTGNNIAFVRAKEYQNFGFLVIGMYDGLLQVYYTVNGNSIPQLSYVQSISSKVATDAHFFVHDGCLFLAVANKIATGLTPTVVYKWINAHFDQVDKIFTRGASAITSFASQDSEILIILQNSEAAHQQLPSIVCEFKNDRLRLIQKLKIVNSTNIVAYKVQGNNYVAVFDNCNDGSLYRWNPDGEELEDTWFEGYSNVEKVILVYVKNIPLIFAAQKHQVLIYGHHDNGLRLINKIKEANHISEINYFVNSNAFVMITLEENRNSTVKVMPFTIDINNIDKDPLGMNLLLQCMRSLELELQISQNELQSVKKKNSNVLRRSFLNDTPIQSKSSAPAFFQTDTILLQSFPRQKYLSDLKDILKGQREKLELLKPQFYKLTADADVQVFNGNVIILGNLSAHSINAKSLYTERLNTMEYRPSQWLSYSRSQEIVGPVVAKTVIVNDFRTWSDGNIFNDILLSSGNQKLLGLNTIGSLKAKRMYIAGKINKISFDDIYLRKIHSSIGGEKGFDNVDVETVTTEILNDKTPFETLKAFGNPLWYSFAFSSGNVMIDNLNFDEINSVQWNTFKDSVFKIGSTTNINGNILMSAFKSSSLYAKSVSSEDVNNLLTTSRDQLIKSIVHFRNIDIKSNILCNSINNIKNVTAEAAILNSPNGIVVTGSVSAKSMGAFDNLQAQYAIGTNQSDLLQIYRKKVKITGILILQNLIVEYGIGLVVNGRAFHPDMLKNYWLKNQHQAIPQHVVFDNGVTIPHLFTNNVNDAKSTDFMLQNEADSTPSGLYFENVTVVGNVYLNQHAQHVPDLHEIDRRSVKYSGSYNIKGKKTFQGVVIVKNLNTARLDDNETQRALSKRTTSKIIGKKVFETVVVIDGDASALQATIQNINDVNLLKLETDSLYIDEPTILQNVMNFQHLTVGNLQVAWLNGKPIVEYPLKSQATFASDQIIERVQVNGNLTIANATFLKTINGVNMQETVAEMFSKVITIDQDVAFSGTIHTNNLVVAAAVNNINMKSLLNRLLFKQYNQNVTASHSFSIIYAQNLLATRIDNVVVDNLINVKEKRLQHFIAQNSIELKKVTFINSLNATHFPCNIVEAMEIFQRPQRRLWKTIKVLQDVRLLDYQSLLYQIVNNTVMVSNTNNAIMGPVRFKGHISAKNVFSISNVNNINISEIFQDAVLKTPAEEKQVVIRGRKRFQSMRAEDVTVPTNAQIPSVNKIVIRKIDESIVTPSETNEYYVRGKKIFYGGLQTNYFYSNFISGIDPKQVVDFKNLKQVPKATFDTLSITENFEFPYINDIYFSQVFEKRILCHSNNASETLYGNYVFASVVLKDNSTTPHINDLEVEDIVTDNAVQNISGEKVFLENLTVNAQLLIGRINLLNFQKLYQNSVLSGRNEKIYANIKCNKESRLLTKVNAENLNGISVDRLRSELELRGNEIVGSATQSALQEISEIVDKCLKTLQNLPDKCMYIENQQLINISFANIAKAQVAFWSNGALIRMSGQEEEAGAKCGLASQCACQVQQEIFINLEQLRMLYNGHRRVFQYNEEKSVMLSTNTLGTGPFCMTNSTKIYNEYSQLTWMSGRTDLKKSYNITGYISDVEFFSLNLNKYVIICQYYNKVVNSYDSSCAVIRISKENGAVSEIQRISTNGAWMAHVLPTAQGVVLIIGNVIAETDEGSSNYTNIYRFDETQDKFILLRNVKSLGCTMAAGVVLGRDSLIILAQQSAPIQVLKYDDLYENYYFYQTFVLESPVSAISVFYTGGFGISEAYLCIVTENGTFNMYTYHQIEGWRLQSSGSVQGLRTLIPLEIGGKSFLFAPSSKISSLLTVVKHSYV